MDAWHGTVSSPDSFPLQPAPPPTSGAIVVQVVHLRRLRPCNSARVSARRTSAASPLRDGSFTSRSPCAAPNPPQPMMPLLPCPQPAMPPQSRPQSSTAPAPSGEGPCLACLVPLATGSVRRPFSPELLLRRQGRAGSCHPCRPQPPSAWEKQLIADA
ncbi:translation initiation factor IF-2 [Triticum aestivum]|uniref:translation initiation factor IF-2 n=1 Tax=Triticum aestivum TaxID=4565 RepID=UPI001D00208B|nr:translation initiation factor IF-2-like [Triticum aestivum]